MRAIRGLDCVLYFDDGAKWVKWGSLRDATVNMSAGEIDVSRRGSTYRHFLKGLKDFEVSGTAIKDDTDPGFVLGHDAAMADNPDQAKIRCLVLDGPLDADPANPNTDHASRGYVATLTFTSWEENQSLEEGVMISFTLKNHPDDDPKPVKSPITYQAVP